MGDAFGSLAWNADLHWWSGAADVAPGPRIDLHVEAANDPAALRAAVTRAELVYADGMLFGGHWIIVPVGADGTVGEASEAG